MGRTIWMLWDQLGPDNAAFLGARRADDVVLFIESAPALRRLKYHKQRLVLLLAAQRHRAEELQKDGWKVDYHELTAATDWKSALADHMRKHRPREIMLAEPNNFDEQQAATSLCKKFPIRILPTKQFLVPREDFANWARGKKSLLMESHYRRVRSEFGFLMQPDGKPVGGQWNFDEENRKTFRDWVKGGRPVAQLQEIEPDKLTRNVMALVEKAFPDHPGTTAGFWLPVDRHSSLRWLDSFIDARLAGFGPWEDLMVEGQSQLFHSVISPMINLGLLTPRECIEKAVSAFDAGRAPLSSVEGFVRQIAGWREFVNGVYWLKMPGYTEVNGLSAERALPDFFYTGETELNCLRQCLRQVIDSGFNHHIQRLMVLGNFLLIAGVRPQEALRWFLEMYVDAHDWVMAANVLGMVLHADGGFMATKPYAAGSGYISRMSNYCAGCRFKPAEKTGPDACPFNYLYWDFFARHRAVLSRNPRVAMAIRTLDKKSARERAAISESAVRFLEKRAPLHRAV
ncbi:MAG: cryptochrome/photolyase family protein [Chthoniobacterales bacterium]|nr:cryptochrome/photolyase family protein [Chthoniobacterales bacterium]